jgi:hypothetical protein
LKALAYEAKTDYPKAIDEATKAINSGYVIDEALVNKWKTLRNETVTIK